MCAGGRSERILLPTRVFRRGKRAMRLRVRRGVSCSMRAKIGWRFRPSGLRRDADAAESVQMRMGTSNRTGRRARAGGSRGRRTKRAPPSGFRPRPPPSRNPAVENRGAPASARRAVPSEQSRQQWVNGFARSFAGQVVPYQLTPEVLGFYSRTRNFSSPRRSRSQPSAPARDDAR